MYNLIPKRGNIVRRGRDYDVFDMMDNFFNNSFFENPVPQRVSADIKQTDNEYIIEAELPGYKKEDIKLELKNNYLTIEAGSDEEKEEEKDGYIRRERRTGQVCRSFYVEGINQEEIDAKYESGVLSIKLPKKQKEEEVLNTIEIH